MLSNEINNDKAVIDSISSKKREKEKKTLTTFLYRDGAEHRRPLSPSIKRNPAHQSPIGNKNFVEKTPIYNIIINPSTEIQLLPAKSAC